MRQWPKNIILVPSKGEGKTEYYSKVHAGNLSRKFCNESAAQKMFIDNKRKMDRRKQAKRRSLVEACKSTQMRPIASFFPRLGGDAESSPLLGVDNAVTEVLSDGLDVDEALQDLDEELDITLGNTREETALIDLAMSNRDRIKHLIKCSENRKGDNMSKSTLLSEYRCYGLTTL